MTRPLLLDTCAVIWTADLPTASTPAREAMARTNAAGLPIYVSPYSGWEIGMLVSKGRLRLPEPPLPWFMRLLRRPGVKLAPMDLDILVASSFLPELSHGDPADRIIIATARSLGLRIVTSDRSILSYAEQGHVLAVAC